MTPKPIGANSKSHVSRIPEELVILSDDDDDDPPAAHQATHHTEHTQDPQIAESNDDVFNDGFLITNYDYPVYMSMQQTAMKWRGSWEDPVTLWISVYISSNVYVYIYSLTNA